ncbi:MAG TPA: hypothetical protein VJ023_21960 [Pyrinomonadaceae bacterium]|nr:hypothetical protein [Pyrinomonadaceae bacterium]
MPHLWIRDETDQWAVFQLRLEEYELRELLKGADSSGTAVSMVRTHRDENEDWHLLAPRGAPVSVNGLPLMEGLRTLRDRDQIVFADRAAYFSTEERARRVSFSGGERKLFCARCRQELVPGVIAVKCPQCNVWHHQTDEFPCWTYSAHCGLCSQLTDLEAGYRWQPTDQG